MGGDFWQIASFVLGLLFLFFFIILPIISRNRHNRELTERFAKIQRRRKARIIAIVHRSEPMGLLGIPQLRYIDLNDAEDVLNAIRRTPANKPLEIILHTPGGILIAALQIARAIKAHPGKKTVFVPHYAFSGGTLIALAADEIVMSKHAVLGPIDPQVYGVPAASVLKAVQQKPVANVNDETLILADISGKAIEQLKEAACELLSNGMSGNQSCAISDDLASGRWTHDFPITATHAAEMGLKVSTKMPEDIMALMDLFPEGVRRPSVRTVDTGIAPPPATGPNPAPIGFQPGPGGHTFSSAPWARRGPKRREG
jgi:ClpP class serine protease